MLVSSEHINHALKHFRSLYGKVVSEFQKDIWLLGKKDVILLFASRYIYDDLKGEYIAPESITNEPIIDYDKVMVPLYLVRGFEIDLIPDYNINPEIRLQKQASNVKTLMNLMKRELEKVFEPEVLQKINIEPTYNGIHVTFNPEVLPQIMQKRIKLVNAIREIATILPIRRVDYLSNFWMLQYATDLVRKVHYRVLLHMRDESFVGAQEKALAGLLLALTDRKTRIFDELYFKQMIAEVEENSDIIKESTRTNLIDKIASIKLEVQEKSGKLILNLQNGYYNFTSYSFEGESSTDTHKIPLNDVELKILEKLQGPNNI